MRSVTTECNGLGEVYAGFGFRLRSDFPLSELSPAAPEPVDPEVVVRLGSVAGRLDGAAFEFNGIQVAPGQALLTVPGVARYLIRHGREIVVDLAAGAPEPDIQLYLLGSALGLLCHQRGLLPLHANTIVAGGGAHAFAGASGAGKSTLAAWFQAKGYEVLGDDVCVVGASADGSAIAWPGLPRLKLWAQAAEVFGHDTDGLERIGQGLDKFHVPIARARTPSPRPFRRLYILGYAEPGAPSDIVRLTGSDAMQAVMGNVYRSVFVPPMGLRGPHFLRCAALVEKAEVFGVRRAFGFEAFDREAAALEAHMNQDAAA